MIRKGKKICAFILSLVMLFGFITPASALQNETVSSSGMDENPFADVKSSDWFYESVIYVYENNLFQGVSDTIFGPNNPMTRAMFVTVLGRLHGADQTEYIESDFADVPTGEWYSSYVNWASDNGIVTGYGDGKFGPEDEINREQMAAIIARYVETFEITLASGDNIVDSFKDIDTVSTWALSGLELMRSTGIIQGDDEGNFNPQALAARAEAAAVFMRLKNAIEISDPGGLDLKMQELAVSDGAPAEVLVNELYAQFLDSPNDFVNILKGQDKSTQTLVIQQISYHAVLESQLDFEKAIDKLGNGSLANELVEFFNSVKSEYQPNIESDIYMPEYDADTIKQFVALNTEGGQLYDEEYYALLANVYSEDTNVFGEIISDLNYTELETMALGMTLIDVTRDEVTLSSNYDTASRLTMLEQTNLEAFESILEEQKAVAASQDKLEKAVQDTFGIAVSSLSGEFDGEEISGIESLAAAPTIGAMSWSNLNVGSTAKLSVIIGDTANAGSQRSYIIKVYCQRDGTWWLKHSGVTVTFDSASTSVTPSIPVSFYNPGTFYTRVEVWDSTGTTRLSSRVGMYPDVTRGNWRINVDLPANRYKVGAIGIYDASGERVKPIIRCLGRAASNASMGTYLGNTPIGDNTAVLGGVQRDTAAYGPYKVVMLYAKSGHPYPNRSGIWIHGGRSQTTLQATNGCIRVFNSDQKLIQDTLTNMMLSANGHNSTGRVIVQQVG